MGIQSYGVYLPYLRIKADEYVKAWGACAAGISEKTVPDFDEDSITMSVAAAREILDLTPQATKNIAFLAVASTSFPYVEKATSTTLIQALGLNDNIFTSEHTTSTAAGLEALLAAWRYLETQKEFGKTALITVADAPQARAWDTLEHGLGAGAVAFLLTKENPIAVMEGASSAAQESLGERYRRTGETAVHDLGVREYTSETFLELCRRAAQNLLKELGRSPGDYHYLIVGQHDARLPQTLGRKLGFEEEKIKPGLLYSSIGDTGAASALLSLAHILDQARPEEKILLLAYGSGAKAIALSLKVTAEIADHRPTHTVNYWLERKKYLDYTRYLKVRRQIV
ncbi:MAG: hydroxymethylglutaryl-CoA synthase [Clostridia bacterium]|nr:hydroxymethylglutaryl-CoA synthase [Clostridia bacterium]